MITFTNLTEAKATFKKTFNKDVTGTLSVQIYPNENRMRIAGFDCFNNLREINLEIESTCKFYKTVHISSISKNSCLWDIIWDKGGFVYDTYRNAFSELETRSKTNGTIFTMAEIVFHSKKREYAYMSYECDSIKVVY